MTAFFPALTGLVLVGYLLINTVYLVGALNAARSLVRFGRGAHGPTGYHALASPLTPGVSILVPVHNGEQVVLDTVRSLLALQYPQTEIIVVDDGSTDATLRRLREEFALVPVRRVLRDTLPVPPVRGRWVSSHHPNLWVVHKERTNRAEALNTGVDAARQPYVLALDADQRLEPDALLNAAQAMMSDPDLVIGTGSVPRAATGRRISRARISDVRLGRRPVAGVPVAEYLRSVLVLRTFWTGLAALPVISGSFAVLRRSVVESVGGWYPKSTSGDDVELVLDLHRQAGDGRQGPYRIELFPQPVRLAEAAPTFADLLVQRRRWHRGTAEELWRQRDPSGRRDRRLGVLGLPGLAVELLAPPLELTAWLLVLVGWAVGLLPGGLFVAFLAVTVLTNLALTAAALTMAQVGWRRTPRTGLAGAAGYTMLEAVGYLQVVALACTFGIVDFLRTRRRERRDQPPRPRRRSTDAPLTTTVR